MLQCQKVTSTLHEGHTWLACLATLSTLKHRNQGSKQGNQTAHVFTQPGKASHSKRFKCALKLHEAVA
jgi:hypothetical protein